MELTVTLLLEFWSSFLEDKPNLSKLYEIGKKLYPVKI